MNKEEAMKVLKDFHDKSALFSVRTALDTIIPELCESEDERIRKKLIHLVKKSHEQGGYALHKWEADEMLAWLENQKEYESTDFEYVWDRTDCGDLTSALDKYSEEAIINMCHAWYDKGIELERKSWLEKQGYTKKDVDDAYLKGICNTKHELEKQGDQKSVDKGYTFKSIPRLLDMIEPTDRAKSYCKKLIDSLQTEGYPVDAKIVGECLKQMNGEKVAMAVMDNEKQDEKKSQRTISAEAKEALYDKPTDEEMKELLRTEYEKGRADTIAEMEKDWSEEADVMINKLLAVVKLYYDRSGDDLDKQSCISFLKFLKDKVQPQPKQEWSEEDEIARKALINLVEMYYGGCIDKTEKKRLLNLLKSLRPQNTWKPSEEQMSTLNLIISDYYHACTKECDKKAIVLKSILEQLKQL